MRIAALIAATAVAFTVTACSQPNDAAADAAAADAAATEAAEASGAAVDTAAMTAEDSASAAAAGANAPSGYSAGRRQTMDPVTGSGTVSDGARAPGAMPGDTAVNNMTDTERRLNPQTAPAK